MSEPRYVRDGAGGAVYQVQLAPRELPRGGVDPELQAIVFEEISGRRVLSAPVHTNRRLDELSDEGLEGLLRDAR